MPAPDSPIQPITLLMFSSLSNPETLRLFQMRDAIQIDSGLQVFLDLLLIDDRILLHKVLLRDILDILFINNDCRRVLLDTEAEQICLEFSASCI